MHADAGSASKGAFGVGDRVRVLDDVPGGNPRTPRYLRGRIGTILRRHGVVDNPLDHHAAYPPLYSVVFPIDAEQDTTGDEVLADLHEDWLVAATTRSSRARPRPG